MQIIGIGSDIVECVRIGRMIERHGELFLERVFTSREIRYCQSRKQVTEHFSGRWAAKEAVFKALGAGWRRGWYWTDLEIRNDAEGRPRVHVGGAARDHVRTLRVSDILVTISHCRAYATAQALAVRADRPGRDLAP
jgi:holo-[acyl-carrier protein] synthase